MSETLRQKQSRFVVAVAGLIQHATSLGYELTFGEAWRTPEQAALNAKKGSGISNSLHIDRLAIDLNLFSNGVYITGTAAHKVLGEWWESQGVDHCWGGHFGDGNHYSITPDGKRK